MYRANSFDDAVAKAEALIALGGKGHTSSIYLNTATSQKRLDKFAGHMRSAASL